MEPSFSSDFRIIHYRLTINGTNLTKPFNSKFYKFIKIGQKLQTNALLK